MIDIQCILLAAFICCMGRVCYLAGYTKGHGDGFCQAHAGMQAAADADREAGS